MQLFRFLRICYLMRLILAQFSLYVRGKRIIFPQKDGFNNTITIWTE